MGAPGAAGADGAQGPAGPQGIQGPQGAVLVLDGGVVVGPPGASVVVTPISAGGAPCQYGGLRVTQVSDGGISSVCNGAPGAPGAPGATGPQGPAGVAGPQGASVTAAVLPPLSPACMTGGVLVAFPDGGSVAVCNGATGAPGPMGAAGPQGVAGPAGPMGPAGSMGAPGAMGAAGPQGVAGPAGPMGPAGSVGPPGAMGTAGPQGVAGPMGPAGSVGPAGPAGPQGVAGVNGAPGPQGPAGVLVLPDGGVPGGLFGSELGVFVGFTSATSTGNLGGRVGAHAMCQAQFGPNAWFCHATEYLNSAAQGAPVGGAWVDWSAAENGNAVTAGGLSAGRSGTNTNSCSSWTNGTTGVSQLTIGVNGEIVSGASGTNCSQLRPAACCAGARATRVRGATAATYTGDLGGRVGANVKCQLEFGAAAHFCHASEYLRAASGAAMPLNGAWIDWSASPVDGTPITGGVIRASRSATGTNSCNGWTNGTNSGSQLIVTRTGEILSGSLGVDCSQPRSIACCE